LDGELDCEYDDGGERNGHPQVAYLDSQVRQLGLRNINTTGIFYLCFLLL
jgi:hypothetical protein